MSPTDRTTRRTRLPFAQLRKCGSHVQIGSMAEPFVLILDEVANRKLEQIVKRAMTYKGKDRKTIKVQDIVLAYENGSIFGAKD